MISINVQHLHFSMMVILISHYRELIECRYAHNIQLYTAGSSDFLNLNVSTFSKTLRRNNIGIVKKEWLGII